MRQLLKKKNLQNHHRSNLTQFNIGLTPSPNHQNYSCHYKKVSQHASNDSVSPTGSIFKSLSKPQGGFSTSKPLLSLQQTSFPKTKSKYIFKTIFQNILTMEEGFYHENPSLLLQRFSLQIGTTNPGIQPNHNPTMPPSLRLPILSSSNTSNYILIILNPHILHASFTKLFTLKIGGNPYINLSPSPYTSVQILRTSILPIHIGITNKHGSMPSSYKITTIAILGFSTSIIQ